ncbi:uncharacterized protein [Miscanthus floridulus]|uniref:uncharacterized protein isoform X2 n=1 Tax=Miscanthus floridulus TaxID=154761 RepID=UPI00345AB71B
MNHTLVPLLPYSIVPPPGDAGTSTEVGFSRTSGIRLTMDGFCCPAVNVSSMAPTEKVAIDHSTCISSDGGYFVNIRSIISKHVHPLSLSMQRSSELETQAWSATGLIDSLVQMQPLRFRIQKKRSRPYSNVTTCLIMYKNQRASRLLADLTTCWVPTNMSFVRISRTALIVNVVTACVLSEIFYVAAHVLLEIF